MGALSLEERHARMKESSPDALAQRHATVRDAGTKTTSLQVGGEMALRRFTDNILNIPGGVGEGLAIGGAGARAVAGAAGARITGRAGDFLGRFREAREDERQRFPASGLIALGDRLPQSTDIVAGFDVFSNLPDVVTRPLPESWRVGDPGLGPAMDEARERDTAGVQERRADHPVASLVGSGAGDLTTLLLGRAPFAGRIREFTNPPPRTPTATVGVQAEFQKLISKPWFQQLDRGFRKSAEAGIEGAALALISEGDPVSTAMFVAGGQAAGSASLWLASKPIKRLTPAIVGPMLAVHLLNTATPVTEPNIFKALDVASNKAVAAISAGLFASLLGAGRLPKATQENLPLIGEALGPALRIPMLTVWRAVTEERERGEDTTWRVMDHYTVDPDAFGGKARKQLERTLEAGGDLSERIQRLMEDRKFRKAYEALDEAPAARPSDEP